MNSAIRDGHDIGWKLAWVLKGWAGDELLDSYEEERRPVAEHNVRRSSDPNGSVREAADELRLALGGRIPHGWVGSGAGRISTLHLLGPGLTLFTTADAPRAEVHGNGAGAPVTVRELPAATAGALGVGPRESLLVRPDGLLAGGGSTATRRRGPAPLRSAPCRFAAPGRSSRCRRTRPRV